MSNTRELLSCKRCPRMQKQFRQLRNTHPDYWNRPVEATGDVNASLIIVGLAPGLHGANRTGIPFTGDSSGELLFNTLSKLEIKDKIRITNVVKCLPVKNAPTTAELKNCQVFLDAELAVPANEDRKVLFALGGVAHRSIIKLRSLRQVDYPFSHGAVHELSADEWLVDSYHCSRYNTQTKRLTEPMFLEAMKVAAKLSGLIQ